MKNTRKRKGNTGPVRLSKARLDELVEEAIVDCYNESEQATGLYTMIEDNLALPFETTVLGVPVTVERVELTLRDEIVAVCRRVRMRQKVPLLDLRLPSPPPAGNECIAAYRHWLRGRKPGLTDDRDAAVCLRAFEFLTALRPFSATRTDRLYPRVDVDTKTSRCVE